MYSESWSDTNTSILNLLLPPEATYSNIPNHAGQPCLLGNNNNNNNNIMMHTYRHNTTRHPGIKTQGNENDSISMCTITTISGRARPDF